MNPLSFSAWTEQQLAKTERGLAEFLPAETLTPTRLHTAMRYSILGGGKRVRALLCYAAAELAGTPEVVAKRGACALELMHAYSLVHDDMPAMDDDDLRRGRPSCHKAFDEATALLVGDALQTCAFEILSDPMPEITAQQQLWMVHTLAKASGAGGMAGGQAIDLAAVGKKLTQAELETMHQLKTGALIEAAVLLGAVCAPAGVQTKLSVYARNIGLAFQVVDDILDVTTDTATLGKTAGKDVDNDKPTYVALMGLKAAQDYAQTLYNEAICAVAEFGDAARPLNHLAQFITKRSH